MRATYLVEVDMGDGTFEEIYVVARNWSNAQRKARAKVLKGL